jgi:hypothetical protein
MDLLHGSPSLKETRTILLGELFLFGIMLGARIKRGKKAGDARAVRFANRPDVPIVERKKPR